MMNRTSAPPHLKKEGRPTDQLTALSSSRIAYCCRMLIFAEELVPSMQMALVDVMTMQV